jgi:hypothetical protein
LALLPALYWLNSYAALKFAVVPQSDSKDQFYGTIYYTTLNLICVAQRVSKNLEKELKIGLKVKMNR